MPHYMLAVHGDTDAPPGPERTPARMEASMAALQRLEADLEDAGAWVFSGHLTDPADATVVRDDHGRTITSDGPYAETKEAVAGFYLIDVADLDQALHWATRVTDCIGLPIEVRPFAATGRVRDQVVA